MTDLIGWTSQLLFMLSAAPQAYKCFVQGHARGLSHYTLWLWFVGEFLAIIYSVLETVPLPIQINYCVNALFMLIILRYRYFERRNKIE